MFGRQADDSNRAIVTGKEDEQELYDKPDKLPVAKKVQII
jgi:hypothetical protein